MKGKKAEAVLLHTVVENGKSNFVALNCTIYKESNLFSKNPSDYNMAEINSLIWNDEIQFDIFIIMRARN
jgi:hypothetical protein